MTQQRVRPSAVVARATEEVLQRLAPDLAELPLFRAYRFSAEMLLERWTSALARGEALWTAREESVPVAVCWFLPRGAFGAGAYLRTLAVSPQSQSRGVGSLLLETFEQQCERPPGGWFLLVSDFNERAQRFYARHGYHQVGQLHDFAAVGIEERIFWKEAREEPDAGQT